MKFDKLLKINKLLSDDFPNINFIFYNYCNESIEVTKKVMDNQYLFNLKFSEICILSMLSPNEFSFWWKMIRSIRTRFNLSSIRLIFSMLSEWLTVLSLCSNCPNLKRIDIGYLEADKENELETVEHAKRKFSQKFNIIQELNISKINRK